MFARRRCVRVPGEEVRESALDQGRGEETEQEPNAWAGEQRREEPTMKAWQQTEAET